MCWDPRGWGQYNPRPVAERAMGRSGAPLSVLDATPEPCPRAGPTQSRSCPSLWHFTARSSMTKDLRSACSPLRSPCGASHHHKYTQTAAGGLPALLPLQKQGCEGCDHPCSHSSRASWSLWSTEALGSHPAGFRLPSRMQLSAKPEPSLCTFGISFFLGSPNEGDRVGSGATSGTQGCAFGALLQICFLRQKASAFCHEAIGFSSEI